MRKALDGLPWASKTTVDFRKKQATVTVVSKDYDEKALIKALEDAGFGGSVVKAPEPKQEPEAKAPAGPRVAFRVSGMKKTKSGAT